MNCLKMFQTKINSSEQFVALHKKCCELMVDYRYQPYSKLFTADTIVESDRLVLQNLNNKYYVQ